MSALRRSRARMLLATACIAAAGFVGAQPPQAEIEKNLLQRQQQQDELLLRQRQFRESMQPSLGPLERREMEQRQFDQRQQQRQLHQDQGQRQLQLQQSLPLQSQHGDGGRLQLQREHFARERQDYLDKSEQKEKPQAPIYPTVP